MDFTKQKHRRRATCTQPRLPGFRSSLFSVGAADDKRTFVELIESLHRLTVASQQLPISSPYT